MKFLRKRVQILHRITIEYRYSVITNINSHKPTVIKVSNFIVFCGYGYNQVKYQN